MFDRAGIAAEELAWIQRDQFVYYVELAYALSDPHDWPVLRQHLRRALTAASGLDHPAPASAAVPHGATSTAPGAVLDLLDHLRGRHDPATEWAAFRAALWEGRHVLRAGL